MTHEEHHNLVEIYEGNPWDVRKRLKAFIDKTPVAEVEEPKKGTRTGQQNRALHLFFEHLAEPSTKAGTPCKTW